MTDAEGREADNRTVSVQVSGSPEARAALDRIAGAQRLIGPGLADAAKALGRIQHQIGPAMAAHRDALSPLRAQLQAVASHNAELVARLTPEPVPRVEMPEWPVPVMPRIAVDPHPAQSARNTSELVRISGESLRVASEQQAMMAELVAEVQAGAKRELDAAKHEAHRFKQTVAIGTVLAFLSAGAGAVLSRLVGG